MAADGRWHAEESGGRPTDTDPTNQTDKTRQEMRRILKGSAKLALATGVAAPCLALADKRSSFEDGLRIGSDRAASPGIGKPLKLFSNLICPFAQRAHIAAVEKNANFEYVKIPLNGEIKKDPSLSKPTYFLENVNPSGTVPALLYDNTPVNESDVCAEFIDAAYGERTLVPTDPFELAKVRAGCKVDAMCFYKLLMNQDPTKDEEFAAKIDKQMVLAWSKISCRPCSLVPQLAPHLKSSGR